MPKIKVRENEDIESALRRFKTQTNRAKTLIDVKEKNFYVSKSVKKYLSKREKIRENKRKVFKEKNRKPIRY
jgi:ribosomal protein S21